ncbi:MAG TPA: hydrogenase maturation protease [Polyangiaceae bacterium]|nr:hydrogenase maturation protease [Polyangiaceae bacterium]
MTGSGAAPAAGRTLLLGMGNPILCDDAVGVRLAAGIARRLGPRPGLDVVPECSAGGLALLDVIAGYHTLIAVGAIRTRGGVPGNWCYLGGVALTVTQHLTNVHDVNFSTALELGRRLGVSVPDDARVHVFAVEVEETNIFDTAMTPALEAALPALEATLTDRIARLLDEAGVPGPSARPDSSG